MNKFITVTTKNLMLDNVAIDSVGLHSGSPSDTGTENELTSVNYARQSCSFGSASGGKRLLVDDAVFNLTAGDVVTHVSYWSAGVFVMYQEISTISYESSGLMYISKNTTEIMI